MKELVKDISIQEAELWNSSSSILADILFINSYEET